MFGALLAWAFSAGLLVLGCAACLLPTPTSSLYGVRQETGNGQAWVRAAGLRDLGIGAALIVLLIWNQHAAAAVVCISTGLVAVTDLVNVLVTRGPRPILPLAVHGSGIVVGCAAGGLLLLS